MKNEFFPDSEEKENRFLVQRRTDGAVSEVIMDAYELASYLNFLDCYPDQEYQIFLISCFGKAEKCRYKGWQPQCLVEVVTEEDGRLVLSMYGEDH